MEYKKNGKIKLSDVFQNDFPFIEIDKGIRKRFNQKKRWGYKNPKFAPKDKGYSFEYDFTLRDERHKGKVYIGIDFLDEFIIVITDENDYIIKAFTEVLIFWIEDKIDWVFRHIDFFKSKKDDELKKMLDLN